MMKKFRQTQLTSMPKGLREKREPLLIPFGNTKVYMKLLTAKHS